MQSTTQYLLEKFLKDRKKVDAEKPGRAPSGFMKKQLETKTRRPAGAEKPVGRSG